MWDGEEDTRSTSRGEEDGNGMESNKGRKDKWNVNEKAKV